MSKKFKIIKDYYDKGEYIYESSSITFKPGITVLVGCNGCGKTTMLKQIQHLCKKESIPTYMYDNYHSGGSNAMSEAGFYQDFERLARDFMSSEGERINNNMAIQARRMGQFAQDNINANELFFLFDAIDSGLSIDYVIEVKRYLFDTVLEDCKSNGTEVYIIVSANEYEMARGENCIDTQTCKYVKIGSYDDYRNLVINSRKKKDKRYGSEEFSFE